jgi:maltose alpha-D-glucosyltransferase/alpha-amylase
MIDDLWYKNAIFYCLSVGTFMDANGDGVGDFEGLMRRLDYLAGTGDEIGMGDDLRLPERQSVRTPMQWTADPHGGFSIARRTILPVIGRGPFGAERVNVADQRRDPGSLLNCVERLIRMRKECPEIGWGSPQVLATGSDAVLAVLARWRGNAVVSLHNFDAQTRQATLHVPGGEDQPLSNLLSTEHSAPDARGRHRISLPPYGYRWYRVGPLLDVTTREPR